MYHTGFHRPQVALDYILLHQHDKELLPDILLLDLSMPLLDGFQVLDGLSKIHLNEKVHLFMLTSSISPDDKKRANEYPIVRGFELKPLSRDTFNTIREIVMKE